MVRLTAPEAVLGGRGSLPTSCNRCGCGGCGRVYLILASSDSGCYSILSVDIIFLFIPLPLFLGGPGGVNIIIVTVLCSTAVRLLPTNGGLGLSHFGPVGQANGDAVHDPERLVLGYGLVPLFVNLL